nr:hypothetical protein [Gordonia bronchialis]
MTFERDPCVGEPTRIDVEVGRPAHHGVPPEQDLSVDFRPLLDEPYDHDRRGPRAHRDSHEDTDHRRQRRGHADPLQTINKRFQHIREDDCHHERHQNPTDRAERQGRHHEQRDDAQGEPTQPAQADHDVRA